MREIRLYGSEGGGAARSPYPYMIEPLAGSRIVAQGKREAGASCAALGQRPDPFNPLPQPVCWVGGESWGEGEGPS